MVDGSMTSPFLVSSRPLPVSHPPHATYLQLVFFPVNRFLCYSKDDLPFALLVHFAILRIKRKTHYLFPFLLPRHHAPVHLLKRYTCPLIKITLRFPFPVLPKTTLRSSHFSSYLQEIIIQFHSSFLGILRPAISYTDITVC
jgi:hypothetical protein